MKQTRRILWFTVVSLLISISTALAVDNIWTNPANGWWEIASNWSGGAPTNTFGTHYITNATTKTVTIVSSLPVGTLTISNLYLGGPAGTTNTLQINGVNEGPFCILNGFTITSGGYFLLNGLATARVEGVTSGAFSVNGGAATINGGLFITTNALTTIGSAATGSLTVNNGSWQAGSVTVGNGAGSQGVLNMAGGTNRFDSWTIGLATGATGTVLVTGGQLDVVNTTFVGNLGNGVMTVSGGVVNLQTVVMGTGAGSGSGTLTIAGGTNYVSTMIRLADWTTAKGTVFITGGELIATNGQTRIADLGTGNFTVVGGNVRLQNVTVSYGSSGMGTLTVGGGTLSVTDNILLGRNSGGMGVGRLWVTNGVLAVDSGSISVGDVSRGEMIVSNGTVRSGQLYIGRTGQGTLTLNGGELIVTNGFTIVGASGSGQMLINGGIWQAGIVNVGNWAGSQGTLTIAGGTNVLSSCLIGVNSTVTGTLWMTGGNLIVTNDTTHIGYSGIGQMTVSNGLFQGYRVWVGNYDGSVGTLTIAGGTNTLTSSLIAGHGLGANGTIWLTGGQLIVTNNITYIGYYGTGQMIVSNGLFQGNSLWVGAFAGSQGTLTVAGGINKIDYNLFVGTVAGSSGELRLNGGELVTTSLYASTFIGESGNGRMTVDGGLWRASYVDVANSDGSTGTLTINGGTNLLSGWLRLGVSSGANGTLQLNNGLLVTTNNTTCLGLYGTGQATVNGGTWLAQAIYVGDSDDSQGALNINGGTITLNNDLILGNYDGADGIITMTGGQLNVTNSVTHVGNVGIGQFYLYGGTFRSSSLKIGQSLSGRGTMLIADGSLEMSGPLTIAETVGSQGALYVYGGQVIATNAAASINIGTGGDATMYMRGGTVNARQVNVGDGTHPGTLYMESGTLTGGSLIVTPSGILQLYSTTISSLVTNQGVIQFYNNPVTFRGGLDNLGNLSLPANQVITVQGGLGNEGGVIIAGNASVLNADNFRNNRHNGIMFLNSAAQLNVTAAWTNNGAIELSQGIIGGGAIQNASLIEGVGAVLAPVVNNIGGTIRANGGLLALAGSSVANQPGGVFEATDGSTLRINRSFLNQGVINNRGGDMDFGSNTLTNQGTLTGYGGFKAATTINDGRALFSGGNVNVYGAYINSATRTTEVRYATASFFGAVTNNSGAVFKNTVSAITFFSTFYNNGIYFSDPATNTFHADLLLGETGKLQGGTGDVFVIGADLASANPYGLDLADAKIIFDVGSHSFTLAGAATIGALALDNDATLTLVGGDLIVGILEASTDQFLTAQTIYYDPSQNPDLDGQTYSLAGGGSLVAVPEPSSGLLAVLSLAVLLGTRAKRTQT